MAQHDAPTGAQGCEVDDPLGSHTPCPPRCGSSIACRSPPAAALDRGVPTIAHVTGWSTARSVNVEDLFAEQCLAGPFLDESGLAVGVDDDHEPAAMFGPLGEEPSGAAIMRAVGQSHSASRRPPLPPEAHGDTRSGCSSPPAGHRATSTSTASVRSLYRGIEVGLATASSATLLGTRVAFAESAQHRLQLEPER